MRTLLAILLFIATNIYGQSTKLDNIENEIRANAIGQRFDKQVVDLNNDKIDDYIYLYQCAEPKCIKLFLSIDGELKEQISEMCWGYDLYTIDNKKVLVLTLGDCCGESPYLSKRIFEFNPRKTILKENYVLTNIDYTSSSSLLEPKFYLSNQAFGKVTIADYNLRFSPTTDTLVDSEKNNFNYGAEDGTNIIAQIKIGSNINILSELVRKNKTWLFVEVDKKSISGKHNPVHFDFKDQKLRGWISDKYVERQ